MKKHAVFLTVLFAMVVTFLSVSAVFWEFYKLNKQQYINQIFSKYSVITQIYKNHEQKDSADIMFEANLAVYKFRLEADKGRQERILKKGRILKQDGANEKTLLLKQENLLSKVKVKGLKTTMLEYQHSIFFFIQSPAGYVLIQDEELRPYRAWNLIYAYTSIILVLTISFLLILQRLRPLTRLRRNIAKFGDGKMDISFKTKGEDEIALVANELENTRLKIKMILESRTLFLRNVMHELKTPIAKGTIATQMLDSQKQIDR